MATATIARTPIEAATLAAELERRKKTARDYVVRADQFQLVATHGETDPKASFPAGPGLPPILFDMSPTAHQQTSEKLGIPRPYYQRMLAETPDLLRDNVNTWAGRDNRGWMIRTLDGRVRANLSDRFKALDAYDLFFATFDVARSVGAEISRATLTDDRFEMRLIHPEWRERLTYPDDGVDPAYGRDGGHRIGRRGDSVFVPGVYVSTSETGKGRLQISPFMLDLVCDNGLINERAYGRVHLGERQDDGYISRETVQARDAVIWSEVKDIVRATFDRELFQKLVASLGQAAGQELADPVKAVEDVAAKFEMSDDDRQAILNELISPSHNRDAGRSVLGLINAITQRAQVYQQDDPDRATAYEAAGGELLATAGELVKIRK